MSIVLKDVGYVYSIGSSDEKTALHDINLDIKENELIGIVGHTGSGKSTLIQMLNGLEKPTQGTVYFHGKDISDKDFVMKELRSKVGLVFQTPHHVSQKLQKADAQDIERCRNWR